MIGIAVAAAIDEGRISLDLQAIAMASIGAQARKEVVFIDGSVAGYEAMLAEIPQGMEIVVLDGTADGLAQMAEWAASHGGYDAIHLISHGAEGALQLGTLTLDGARRRSRRPGRRAGRRWRPDALWLRCRQRRRPGVPCPALSPHGRRYRRFG